MIDSLSKRINLRVNTYPVILNKRLNESELNQHNIKKADFSDRLIIKPARDEVAFFAKNCVLNYINDDYKNSIVPILDPKVGSRLMYGTTAYLWYRDNSLTKFVFQVIYNEYAAKLNLEKLESKLINILGMPLSSDSSFIIWEVENEKIILEFPHNKQHGYIHLMFNE